MHTMRAGTMTSEKSFVEDSRDGPLTLGIKANSTNFMLLNWLRGWKFLIRKNRINSPTEATQIEAREHEVRTEGWGRSSFASRPARVLHRA